MIDCPKDEALQQRRKEQFQENTNRRVLVEWVRITGLRNPQRWKYDRLLEHLAKVISKKEVKRGVSLSKSNGSLRICADFSTGLNDALDLHQYPLPLPEDIFATLNGGRYFTHIDLADACLQIKVDDQSKRLLTINTHRGLYQYNRLPFGVKSAPAIFQQIMDTTLAGLQGVVAYLDDVIVVGRSVEEHQHNLNAVFKRIADSGLHVRLDKCNFATTQITYLGYIIDKDGRRPDPSKIEAIQRMPAPKDVAQLRSFLGLLSYYGKFVKEMHVLRAPLDALLKKNTKFEWTKTCDDSFNKAKQMLASDLLLAHFDPRQEIVVAADASNYGIGAVILHRYPNGSEKAIAHASRSLLPAEKNYSQIEKEGLALIYAIQKFHKMLHGRKFTLLTDHKPLLAIFGSKKGIPVYTANRLQRWATILLGYDFSIQYRSTTSIGQADALSRLIASQPTIDEDRVIAAISVDADIQHVFINTVRALPVTADEIKEATTNDRLLQLIKTYIKEKWPKSINNPEIQCFYNRRDSLSMLNGCLLLAERVVIPKNLQQRVLRQLHHGHPGIVRMKALARSYAYWPGIDKDVEDAVRRCTRCSSAAKSPVKTTLATWPIPKEPWTRVHIDYAGPFEGTNFLVVVDAYSKWPEILTTNRTTSTTTIHLLRQIFARFGMPETLVSDNGTQFTSAEFKNFCLENGIQHIFSPPYHPQSNGQAERFVDTFKRSLLKLKGEGTLSEILQTFLLTYRTTPNPGLEGSKSPAELCLGRKLRTSLSLLKPTVPDKSLDINTTMERQFNRKHGARRRTFKVGDPVLVKTYQGQQRWANGQVLRRLGLVLYEVLVGKEKWIRHTNQLRIRFGEGDHNATDDMDTLFEMFDLKRLQSPIHSSTSLTDKAKESTTLTTQNVPQLRRSTRTRRAPRRLVIDPVQKSYRTRGTNS
ncbi:hypothetical protein Y032_0289g1517 [Ancylostoma ceylanicum]|uniref:RNA-directed DNA polymerase n=2 Tax=Ancylostoma ceylanicum TaxID=53326 RepID=A0A016S6M7_9BILA|nr:hypothetical protein Y032_0289g1517 [Ancylostoma ceylanicum]